MNNIYEVTVCRFISAEAHGYVQRLITDEYITWKCLIDFEHSIATNLFTGEQVYILKRNDKNKILSSEKDKIVMGVNYGVSMSRLNFKTLSTKEQVKIKLAYLKHIISRNNTKKHAQKTLKR